MTSQSPPPTSLHQILQTGTAVPHYIQVRPRGFKDILHSTVEFLDHRQLSTTLLAKLPPGSPWQDDLVNYCKTTGWQNPLYTFSRLPYGEGTTHTLPNETKLPLGELTDWQNDYFLLILGTEFTAMVVAHRLQPMSAGAPQSGTDSLDGGDLAIQPGQRSSYLSVCCSINPTLIGEMRAEVRQTVTAIAQAHPYDLDIQELITGWDRRCPMADPGHPAVLDNADRWLSWQVRQQEHLRQSASTYREQALSASSLSSQNEVLLNTLRLKDNFLNTVGQELRTPLTTIKTALSLLASPGLKTPQRQRYMDMISHECDRQSALISGVLNLMQTETSLGQLHPKALHLSDTIPPIVSTYQPLAAEKGILLTYLIPDQVPPISCPDLWLRQIMIHLLDNSIRYTSSGGNVRVWVSQREDMVEIQVQDTGVGIATSDIPHLFEHFYRGRTPAVDGSEGAGLGLSIVEQLLTYCGGTIAIKSQPDQGSTFKVYLPTYQD